MYPLLKGVVVAILIIAYYRYIARLASREVQRKVRLSRRSFRILRRYTTEELAACSSLFATSILHVLFCWVLFQLADVPFGEVLDIRLISFALLIFGFILGIGEAACGSWLGYLAMNVMIRYAPRLVPDRAESWIAQARGGWMKLWLRTAEGFGRSVIVGLAIAHISVEELLFRGLLVSILRPTGIVTSVLISTLLFAFYQTLNTQSWLNATFAVAGAVVIGAVHATLYFLVPTLLPLVIAHITMFMIFLMFSPRRNRAVFLENSGKA
jgi:membrane protease YdiL (CAAX protease family)